MKRVTIRDIAEKLGVGKTTVSLALMDKYGVNEETKTSIRLAAVEMGYNFSRINVKRKNSKTIKLVLSDKSFLTSIFWTDIIKGIEKESLRRGFRTDTFVFSKDTLVSEFFNEMIKGTSVGVIFVDIVVEEHSSYFESLNLPVVLVDPRNYYGSKFTQVKSNNYLGGAKACEFLWERGHRDLCFVGTTSYGHSLLMRYLGFSERFKMLNAGGEGSLLTITAAETGHPSFMHSEEQLLAEFSKDKRPTGIFCGNDMIAIRTIDALKSKFSLRCPEDISVIGYDNVAEFSYFSPKLTTVNIDKEEMGRLAVEILFEEKDGGKLKKCIELNSEIIEKESVRRINKR